MNDAAAPTPELRDAADKKAAEMTKQRIARMAWEGREVWLKKPVPPKASRWNKLQAFFAHAWALPILHSTSSPGGVAGLKIEVQRISDFKKAGIAVPDILAATDNWIILEDLGEMIERKLKKNPENEVAVVTKCVDAVAHLHKAGLAHGRAKLNDMVLMNNGEIGFIDFEENILSTPMTLAQLQARDVWLFLCSAAYFEKKFPGLVESLYKRYNAAPEVRMELKKLVRALSLFRHLFYPLRNSLGGDFYRAFTATDLLRKQLT